MLNGYTPVELMQMAAIQYSGNPFKTAEAFTASVMVSRKVFVTDIQMTIDDKTLDPTQKIVEYSDAILPPVIEGTTVYYLKPVVDGEVSLFFGHSENEKFAAVYSHTTRAPHRNKQRVVNIKVISNIADTKLVTTLTKLFLKEE